MCVCVYKANLRESIGHNMVPADVEVEEGGVPHSCQQSVDESPLPLVDVTGSIIQQKPLHLVGGAQDEGVLEKRELLILEEGVPVELVVVDHVDSAVELLVTKLLPLERRSQDINWVDLQKNLKIQRNL